jgi:hypothetical protein
MPSNTMPSNTMPSEVPTTGPTTTGPATTDSIWVDHVYPWLVCRRNEGATPAEITTQLVGVGWDADAAARTSFRSLRRSDRNALLYGSLCWSVGLTAVGLTTGVHQLLSPAPDRSAAALALTVALVAAPVAIATWFISRRVEDRSTHAIWSPARRAWFGTLATCTAVVGVVRLVTYVYRVIASLTRANPTAPTSASFAQVLVSAAVAVPLFVWSFREWRRSNVVISGLADAAQDATIGGSERAR